MPGKLSLASLSGRSSASSIDSATGEVRQSGRSSFDRSHCDRGRPSTSSKSSGAKGSNKRTQTRIGIDIESPPLVLYGNASNSSGALLSGRLKLMVAEYQVQIDRVRMSLLAKVSARKPVSSHCSDCATKVSELNVWNFLTGGALLRSGIHDYPFSYLVQGHLPATTHGSLGSIEYYLSVIATTLTGDEIKYEHPIKIQRALHPGSERTSVRIFPPTCLTASVILPSMVHPIGEFPIHFRLEGIVHKQKHTRWKLRKVSWRIEEHFSMISPACQRHSAKLGGEGKGVLHEDIHTIGGDELKNGWKTDFGRDNGIIEMEFQATIKPGSGLSCDVESPCGLAVTHNLIIELIVAEEHCPNKNTRIVTPTGAARVLRMQFKSIITERSGLGISWDEEQPPTYGDVPESPPTYSQIRDYDLAHDDLETLYIN
ncbi:hypothetical protein FGG08_000252 [Glutinoglossum americanum]|uniref:LDB19 N-terminal domain-containing protein n=1 Tax=Glutinoglossum americanum TaxID=1670608 RepID=A0A9P8IIB3_9PEZI|nr:hypothetical protein FGG08_000252 [Glutinoglossum americanum]